MPEHDETTRQRVRDTLLALEAPEPPAPGGDLAAPTPGDFVALNGHTYAYNNYGGEWAWWDLQGTGPYTSWLALGGRGKYSVRVESPLSEALTRIVLVQRQEALARSQLMETRMENKARNTQLVATVRELQQEVRHLTLSVRQYAAKETQ